MANAMLDKINENRRRNEKISKTVHIAYKFIDGYQDLANLMTVHEANGERRKMSDYVSCHHRPPTLALVDDHEVPVKGIMQILAVSRLMGDTDCLGGGFKNAGFIVQKGTDGVPVAVLAVKIDTGFSFNFRGAENIYYQSNHPMFDGRKLVDMRDIQFGNTQDYEIQFKCLLPEQERVFLKVFHAGMQRLREKHVMRNLLWQNGQFNKDKPRVKEIQVDRVENTWLQYLSYLSKDYGVSASDSSVMKQEQEKNKLRVIIITISPVTISTLYSPIVTTLALTPDAGGRREAAQGRCTSIVALSPTA